MDSRQGALHGLHILVVEDDPDAREILKGVLTYFGALVTVVANASEAVQLLHQVTPDVVIADMLLGTSHGPAVLKQARREGNYAPFIAISSADFDPEQLARAGFAAYMRKPLDHNKLVDTILAVISAG